MPPSPRAPPSRWAQALRLLLGVALLALCVFALRRLDWAALLAALRGARLSLVALAMLLNLVQLAAKSERWRRMLSSAAELPPLRLYHYLVVAYASSMVLPGPAGELLRIYLLRKRHGVPASLSTAVVLLEKLFDGIGLIALVAPLPLLLVLPRAVSLGIVALCLGGLAVVAAVLVFARSVERHGFSGRFQRWAHLAPGLDSVRRPGIFFPASALSLLAHLLDAAAIVVLMRSIGLDLPVAASALVILALSFALIVPLTPGHVGALEAGVVGALGLLGTPPEQAVAFGLVYHSMQVLPVMLLGVSGVGLIGEARAEEARGAEA